jgi:hypothetical protein
MPVWAIVLLILVGVGALCALALGVFLWRVWSSLGEGNQKDIKSAWNEGMRAGSAPGAIELRDVGCMPNIIDVATMPALTKLYAEGGGRSRQPLDVDLIVECRENVLRPIPSCETVAATYVTAVGRARAPFRATVVDSKSTLVCTVKLDESGAKL